MPLYCFECDNGHSFEEFLSVSESTTHCPECGAPSKRVLAPVSMRVENYDSSATARQQAYLESPEGRARIKSGELRPMRKSDDAAHM